MSQEAVGRVEDYLVSLLEYHNKVKTEFHNKLEFIDVAYARYRIKPQENGDDIVPVPTGIIDDPNSPIVPVVIGQVDSFVGYTADVFLSGYPLFPVVSEPKDKKEAEMLETILDNHATLGGYPREFLMSFRDGFKYNFMPLEHSWEPIENYELVTDHLNPTEAARMKQHTQFYTKIKRRDPYNTVWDRRVAPADVCYKGEFCGYIDIEPRIPLKRFINMYSQSGKLYNIGEIGDISKMPVMTNYNFTELPTISHYLVPRKRNSNDFDWEAWLTSQPQISKRKTLQAGAYERFNVYCRIVPSELGIKNVPQMNSPQIWKFILINGRRLLFAEKVYSAYDALPMLIGQPLEDGFELQTPSIGESQIEMQEAASTLFSIRFNAARRAVSDRALFDPTLINQDDVNTTSPAPKIPVRLSGLNDKSLDDAYKQIPYDPHGTDSVIQDVRNILDFSDRLSGLNHPMQGRFQKGNKSVTEWQDTMAMADNRPRIPALNIEFQVMVPLKNQLKMNIYQHGVTGVFQNAQTGVSYDVNPEALEQMKQRVLSFRLADGYTPKSKLASTEFIGRILETISQNQVLAQQLGGALPNILAHLAQLGGVRGLEQYLLPPEGATGGAGQPAAAATVSA